LCQSLVPFPGQKFLELTLRRVGDASEHIGESRLRIDVVDFCRRDQGGHDSGTVGAALGAREQPWLSSEGEAAQGALEAVRRIDLLFDIERGINGQKR
jgi:hypothetical protein